LVTSSASIEGQRLRSIPLNPEWLGGAPSAQAQLYEQSKVNHCKVIYKPYVDPLKGGAIALAFDNDPDHSNLEVGTPVLKSFAEGTYTETKVTEPVSLNIRPVDMNVRYDADGGAVQSVQGMLRALTASPLEANLGLGHLYLEYDIEFFNATLASVVSNPLEGTLRMSWTGVAVGDQNIVYLSGLAATASNITFGFNDGVGAMPPNGDYIYTCNMQVSSSLPSNPIVEAANMKATPFGLNGQEFFARTYLGASGSWTDGSAYMVLFNTLAAAQQFLSANNDVVSNGQLYYGAADASKSVTLTAHYLAVPVV